MVRRKHFPVIIFTAFLAGSAVAQSGPPPPAPVAESDIRDNTIKMRAIELERVKRDAHKVKTDGSTQERGKSFKKIKKHFENIQRLQDSIIAAYTMRANIEYPGISKSAKKMNKSALLLEREMFAGNVSEDLEEDSEFPMSVRALIIELDNSLGRFVSSPIFKNIRIVDKDLSQSTHLELRKIIKLSALLSESAAAI